MPISEVKMDLFDAPPGATLVHACNCRGVWGRGIAKDFKERFPNAFESYFAYCLGRPQAIVGTSLLTKDSGRFIGCLMTSNGYRPPDKPDAILRHTRQAIEDLLRKCDGAFYSNKFNSGLFGVAWEDTRYVLEGALPPDVTWVVCDPNLVSP